jgi:hypothetical protein
VKLKPVEFAYDYNQLYVYDAELDLAGSHDGNPYLDALDAATQSGLTVGAASGIVDVLMPRQENFSAVIDVIQGDSAPSVSETADHVVEFDLTSSGRIKLEGSGGSGELEIEIPRGAYRARLSGFEFDAASRWSYDDPGYPADHYLLELWPSDASKPPSELRRWAGYAERL